MKQQWAFYSMPASRARDLLQALSLISEAVGANSFVATSSQIATVSTITTRNVQRSLGELEACGYVSCRGVPGYRTTFAVTIHEDKIRAETQLTMSRVRTVLEQFRTTHLESSLPPGRPVARLESKSPNLAHLESSFAQGEGEEGGGGVKGMGALTPRISQNLQPQTTTQAAAGFNQTGPQISIESPSANMTHHESSSSEATSAASPPENPQQQPPFSQDVFDPRLDPRDLPMLEALADQFIQLYPRKSANRLLILGAFRDQAAALAGKVGSEFENQGPVDAGLYLLDRARAYAAAVEGVPDARKGFLPTAANWLAQGRHDWPEWQWKDAGREHGSTNGRDGGNRAKPEAFDVQATLQRVREQWGGGESGGDHPGVPEAPEALREDASGGAHDVVAGNPNGAHGDGAREGVRGRPTRGVLPDRREAMGFRRSR